MPRNRYRVHAFDVVGENFAGEFLILSSLHGPLAIGARRPNNMRVGDRLEHHEFEIVGETTVRWMRFVETAANTHLHRTDSGPRMKRCGHSNALYATVKMEESVSSTLSQLASAIGDPLRLKLFVELTPKTGLTPPEKLMIGRI